MDKDTKKLLKRAFIAGAEASFYRHEQPEKFRETKDIHPHLKTFYKEFIERVQLELDLDKDDSEEF